MAKSKTAKREKKKEDYIFIGVEDKQGFLKFQRFDYCGTIRAEVIHSKS